LEWGSGRPPLFFDSNARGRAGRGGRKKRVATPIPEIEREMEVRIESLGMELVQIEWAGSDRRPILRIRVDFPDSRPGEGVTVDDCVRVSRGLEPWLDAHPVLPERYTIEVSSPGVERPLARRRDFVRFKGEEVALKGTGPLGGTGSTRIEGVLEGVAEGADEEHYGVLIRRKGGEVVEVPRDEIVRAHLVFRWNEEG
jgi:ribosome maturation factor RimP